MNLDAIPPLGWALFGVAACALFVLGVWFFRPGGKQRLLPPQRQRAVPWTVWEVLGAFFVVPPFWMAVVAEVLLATGVFAHLYGPDFAKTLEASAPEADRQLALARLSIWVSVLGLPPTVASIVLLLRMLSGTEPYQLGLTGHRWGRNVLAGFVAWVAFTPFTYLLLEVADRVLERLHAKPEEHALTRLAQQPLRPVEWVLLVLSAVVAAPVLEELLFRGVLQRWLARHSWGGMAAVTMAVVLALSATIPEAHQARQLDGWFGVLRLLAPVWFTLVLAPGVLLLQKHSDTAAAIYGTALLFGMAHATVWPTPVPLFLLGLVLGTLAARTQSLVGPMTLHALFNAVACVLLIGTHLAPPPEPEKGNEATSAPRSVVPASTSTAVPGSWCPRRRYASAIGPSRGDTTEDVTFPTSSPPRSMREPCGAGPAPWSFNPASVRLTWPRSRAMTMGSWPR